MSPDSQDESQAAHVTARGMLIRASKDLVSSAAAVVFFVFVARFLPNVSDLGFLIGLQTLTTRFIILSGVGLPGAATRFISSYLGSGRRKGCDVVPIGFYNKRSSGGCFFNFVVCIISSIFTSFLPQLRLYPPTSNYIYRCLIF